MSRPRILDEAKRRDVCALLSAGVGLDAAARYAGCSVSTIRREAVRNDQFARDLRASETRSQLDPLKSMRDAARSHWRAAAWLLERANPRQFDRHRHAGCSQQEFHDVIEAIIQQAVEEIDDLEIRDRVCRQMFAAAYRASRALAAERHARLNPRGTSSTYGAPFDPGPSSIDALLAELGASQRRAAAEIAQKNQNPKPPGAAA
jgi:hypothetical protein